MVAVGEIINLLTSDLNVTMNFGIQLGLGAIIGYNLRKAFANVLAVVISLVIGAFLNMWTFAQLKDLVSTELDVSPEAIPELIPKLQGLLLSFYGIIGMTPMIIGILVGFLVAGLK